MVFKLFLVNARTQTELIFDSQKDVPEAVKLQIMSLIRSFLDKQIE
jgi:hypothetical protein